MNQKTFRQLIEFFKSNRIHIHGIVYVYHTKDGWEYRKSGNYDYKLKKQYPVGTEISDKELKRYNTATAAAQFTSLKIG